jgi:hypothetical protein
MKSITLALYNGEITIDLSEPDAEGERSGSLRSVGLYDPPISEEESGEEQSCYNYAITAIEALILAHACAGVDVESHAYITGINVTIDAAANNLP